MMRTRMSRFKHKSKHPPIKRTKKSAKMKPQAYENLMTKSTNNLKKLPYKDSHSIGKRQSSSVATYSENGRLYYDLHTQFGPEKKSSRLSSLFTKREDSNSELSISDSSTIACVVSPVINGSKVKRKSALRKSAPASLPSTRNRREASLNASAKVNMIFESMKSEKCLSAVTNVVPSKRSSITESKSNIHQKKNVKRIIKKLVPSTFFLNTPPAKRVAGLNAKAIIRAVITPLARLSKQKGKVVNRNSTKNSATGEKNSETLPRCAAAVCELVPTDKCTQIQVAKEDFALHSAALPTVESFQARKVVTYGTNCYGLENITRQIIRVPGKCAADPATQQILPTAPVNNGIPIYSPILGNFSSSLQPVSFATPLCVNATETGALPLVLPAQQHFFQPASLNLRPPVNVPVEAPYLNIGQQLSLQNPMYIPRMFRHPDIPTTNFIPSYQFLPNFPNYVSNATYCPFPIQPQFHFPLNYVLPMPLPSNFNAYCPNTYCCVTNSTPHPSVISQQPLQVPLSLPPHICQSVDTFQSPLNVHPIPASVRNCTETPGDPSFTITTFSSSSTPILPITSSPLCVSKNIDLVDTRTPIKRVNDESCCLWQWEGSPSEKYVFLKPDTQPVMRTCYPSIRHQRDGMVISVGDNVLLCSGPDRHSAPHVAKITGLFPDIGSGTKLMALLWYYRPDSLNPPPLLSRRKYVESELFASRHCDVNPVDCIEDRAYVLSAAAYARFVATMKYRIESRSHRRPVWMVPPLPVISAARAGDVSLPLDDSPMESSVPHVADEFPEDASLSNVFLCRAIYDFRSRRVTRNLVLASSYQALTVAKSSSSASSSSSTASFSTPDLPLTRPDVATTIVPLVTSESSVRVSTPRTDARILPHSPPHLPNTDIDASEPRVSECLSSLQAPVAAPLQSPIVSTLASVASTLVTLTPSPLVSVAPVALQPTVACRCDASVLDTTADLSVNWGEHGEQIALSLGSGGGHLIESGLPFFQSPIAGPTLPPGTPRAALFMSTPGPGPLFFPSPQTPFQLSNLPEFHSSW